MEQDRFIKYLTLNKNEYTPFSRDINEYLFFRLEERLIEVGQWEATEEIDREKFEEKIGCCAELVNAYIDMYSKSARFFTSEMDVREEVFEFYMLVKNKRIDLIYYRKIPIDQSRFA